MSSFKMTNDGKLVKWLGSVSLLLALSAIPHGVAWHLDHKRLRLRMPRTMTTAEAGRLGGLRSRRQLSAESARAMVCVREARKLFRTNYLTCFWWARSDLVIHATDVAWVADGLRKHGGREAWRAAARLEGMLVPTPA